MAETAAFQIEITVKTQYLGDQSDPAAGRYVFVYFIKLLNTGTFAAQLISRHWIITDADGKQHHVRGLGVVGKQPLLEPGQSFEYSSGCVLETPVGTMRGSYQMATAEGVQFSAPIPEFVLSMPRTLH